MQIRNQQGRRGRRQQHNFAANAFLRRQAVRRRAVALPKLTNLELKELKKAAKHALPVAAGLLAMAAGVAMFAQAKAAGEDPVRYIVQKKLQATGKPAGDAEIDAELRRIAVHVKGLV